MSDTNQQLFELRKRRALLQQKKVEILRANALALYRPFPKQEQFHRSTARRRMVRAGNRFGKSHMGCAEDCAWLLGERIWFPENDPARRSGIPQRPVKGLVITTDWDKVDEVWTTRKGVPPGKLFHYLPKERIKGCSTNHSGAVDEVELDNGSVMRFETVKSFMANPQGIESASYDFIHVDEPCPQQMWVAASRGLMDTGGFAWFTLTPLKEFWINEMFFPNPMLAAHKQYFDVPAENRWSLNGSTYDNPYLSRDAIAEFELSLSEDEKQCRIHGLPLELSGLVYKEFSFEKHVLKRVPAGWEDYNRPPRDYSIYYAIDPHPQTPHAVLFIAVSPQGQIFVYDEIFEHTTISALSSIILSRVEPYFVVRAKCDPLAYINDPITDSNMAEEFAINGVFVEKATKDLSSGILAVKALLAKPQGAVFFSPHLRETLYELNMYAWNKDNKPIDKHDHMLENFYRLVLDKPAYIDQDKAQSEPVRDMSFTATPMYERDYNVSLNDI